MKKARPSECLPADRAFPGRNSVPSRIGQLTGQEPALTMSLPAIVERAKRIGPAAAQASTAREHPTTIPLLGSSASAVRFSGGAADVPGDQRHYCIAFP